MNIEILKVGELHTNCYIVSKNGKAIIIDPGAEGNRIIESVKNYEVVGILVTHFHHDHIWALVELEKHYKLFRNVCTNENFNYEIIYNPGHSEDSISFYFRKEKIMFTGDFLFYHTIGRVDLKGSSIEHMKESLEMISKYDDDIKIYPGHGWSSILGEEKKHFREYF